MTKLLLVLFLCAAPISAQETLLVVQKMDDSLGFYAAESGQALGRVSVGVKPHEMALSRDERFAYVTNYGVDSYADQAPGGNTISIVDLRERKNVGEIDLGRFRRPHGIEMGRSGRLYVTVDAPASLLVIDPARRRIITHYALDQALPHMLVVARDERKVYVANSGSGTVTVVRPGGALKRIEIGGVPMGMALAADGRRLYATNRTGNSVAVIDTRKDELTASIEIPGQPVRLRLTRDDRHLLVTLIEDGAAVVVETATLQVKHRFAVGRRAEGVTIDPANRFAYISAQGDNRVRKFALPEWQPVLEIRTAARPDPLVIINLPPGRSGAGDAATGP